MAEELPTAAANADIPALRAGALSFRGALGLGVAYLALGAQLVFAPIAFIGASGAGSWLAILVSLPVLACLGVAISKFSSKYVVSGSLMSYLGEAFGAKSRNLAGICLLLGYAISIPMTAAIALIYVEGLLTDFDQSWGSTGGAQLAICGVILAFAAFVSSTGAARSAQVATILGLLAVPFAVVIVGAVAKKGLDLGPQLSLAGVTPSAIVAGAVIMFGGIVGFEGVTALAAETRNPTRNVPRLILALLVIVTAVFLVAILILTPVLLSHQKDLVAGESPTSILAEATGLGWIRVPLNATLAATFIACIVPSFNDASRVFATAAADGILPSRLSRVNARTRAPRAAIVILAVLAVVVLVGAQLLANQSPLELFVSLVSATVYLWLIPYVEICVGVVVLMRREGKLISLISLAGVVGAGAMVFILLYSITHAQGKVQQLSPWLCMGAVAVLYVLQTCRKSTTNEVDAKYQSVDVET